MSEQAASVPVVLVNDRVRNPDNPRQLHYRLQAQTPAGKDGLRPTSHVHVDLEGTLRDTTVEVGSTQCDDADETGLTTFTFAPNAQLANSRVLLADCANRDGQVLYGRIVRLAGDNKALVNTTFPGGELSKLHAAFESYHMQSYAGPTPIEHSKHLSYLKELGADPGKVYGELSKRYGRPAVTGEPQQQQNLRTDATARARALADAEVSVDAKTLFNCETVSSDQSARGCAAFSTEKLPLADLSFTAGATQVDLSLSCVECAATVEGASLYASFDSEFSIDIDWGAIGDFIDDVGDVADDVIDTGGDVVDDVVDTGGDIIDDVDDFFDRRALQGVDVTAEVTFSFGGELNGLAIDFALLLELLASSSAGSPADEYEIYRRFIPKLGVEASALGIDFAAGVNVGATVAPEANLEGTITAQAGTKLILDGSFGFSGAVGLTSGIRMDVSTSSFRASKFLDTPMFTATVNGDTTLTFNLDVQCGLWAGVDTTFSSTASAGVGGALYATLGVPVVVEAAVAASGVALLSSIPSAYCVPEADDNNFFIGDCTQPNNLQAQVQIYTQDVYGRVTSELGLTLEVEGIGVDESLDYSYQLDQSTLTGFALGVGPYSLTYCDCILYDGIDCSAQGSGSQCPSDSFPPASARYAPAYNADSPPSGMQKAWDNDAIGELDANTGLSPGEIAAIVICCLLVVAAVGVAVYFLVIKKKQDETKQKSVAQIANKFGGQVKRKKRKKKKKPKKKPDAANGTDSKEGQESQGEQGANGNGRV